MHDLPGREARVCGRVPTRWQLFGLQEPHLASFGLHNACIREACDGGHLGLAENFGDAVIALREPVLFETGEHPAAVGVKIAFLFGERLVERRVD